jgi:FlaA1/EpsC-like NDP-sugar epimerase
VDRTSALELFLKYRRVAIVGSHLILAGLSNYVAFWLRFDGSIPDDSWNLFLQTVPLLICTRGVGFIPFRLYEGLWRYTSVWDLRSLVGGVLASSLTFYFLVHFAFHLTAYPPSVFVVDSVLLLCMLGGLRLTRRICRELGHFDQRYRVLVYGAGNAGESIVRDMHHNRPYAYQPIGFVDDNPAKVGRRIHGVKVLGTRREVSKIIAATRPDVVVVAIPSAGPSALRSVVQVLEPFKVPIQTLPNLGDVLAGKVTVNQIRELSIVDLLERAPVGLDPGPVRHLIEGKRALITGAGGSIGSELSRQILKLRPAELVLVDRSEHGLQALATELAVREQGCRPEVLVADVTDPERIASILSKHRPEVIFHAAAHKHVPLMEENPCEAVKNNVRGTRLLAAAARHCGVERFILISTDKAVNPSSVMGATKRVAELLIQEMNGHSASIFAAVRFGNVLGSSGSVVPHFLEQIKAGGPVTVTHPEMRRYFMLIPEAVYLVLQAATLSKGGDIFVLDMGEPVRILDLARNLIRLCGFVPEEEIPIRFIGQRPGEKLCEDLVGADEIARPSSAQRIKQVQSNCAVEYESLGSDVVELERAAAAGDAETVMRRLCMLVPTYKPADSRSAVVIPKTRW